jgi:hypothetical protein
VVEAVRIYKQLVYEGGNFVSRRNRPPLPLPGVSLVLISVRGESTTRTQIESIKNRHYPIRNRTRDLLVGRTVPQPTAPPRTPLLSVYLSVSITIIFCIIIFFYSSFISILSLIALSTYSSIRTTERQNILYVDKNKKLQYLYQVVGLLLP